MAAEIKQDGEEDKVGDWVRNEIKLPQYEDAFKNMFRNSDLSKIGLLTAETFEQAIIKMMGGHENADYADLLEFVQAHKQLRESIGM